MILSKRSLKLSSFLFIHFFSVQWQWFLLVCLPAHWFILLYHLVYYWFFLVYFFHFSYCILHLCLVVLYIFSLLKLLNYHSIHQFFSWVLLSSLQSLLRIISQGDCLSPLHLVLLLELYLVALSGKGFSVISFCLSCYVYFYVCSMLVTLEEKLYYLVRLFMLYYLLCYLAMLSSNFGRKAMTNLDSILQSRDITLLTKVHLVKVMVFPVVMYGCESWSKKKTEHWRTDAFKLSCWRRLLRVPWTARRSNQSILKEINSEYSLEGLMLKLKLQYFGHLSRRADSLGKTLMLGKIDGKRRSG